MDRNRQLGLYTDVGMEDYRLPKKLIIWINEINKAMARIGLEDLEWENRHNFK